jgi:hypothetical protein
MDFNPSEIEKVLRHQQRFHQEQLRLIEIALAAIESGKKTGKKMVKNGTKAGRAGKVKKHRIQWTKEIDSFLDDYDEFIIMDLQKDLADKRGIASAMTIQGRNVINNTLNRLEKKGRIHRIRPGVYKVVKESFPS